MTKHEIAETLRREEVNRGLVFDYCLHHGRHQPQPRALRAAPRRPATSSRSTPAATTRATSATSAAWASSAQPDAELEDLLGFVEEVQQATRKPVKPGARGGDIIDIGERMVRESPHAKYTHYMAHGMGLVSHEAPRLMNMPRLSYAAYDADRPLEPGMVISIETTMAIPSAASSSSRTPCSSPTRATRPWATAAAAGTGRGSDKPETAAPKVAKKHMAEKSETFAEWIDFEAVRIVRMGLLAPQEHQADYMRVQIRVALRKAVAHGRDGLSDEHPPRHWHRHHGEKTIDRHGRKIVEAIASFAIALAASLPPAPHSPKPTPTGR